MTLTTAATFREFTRQVMLDLRHPMLPICPVSDPLAVATEVWHRNALREVAERIAAAAGLNLKELIHPPEPTEPVHTAYCERCGAQFVTLHSTCGDCGGRARGAAPLNLRA